MNESTEIAEWDNDKYAFDFKDIANMINNSYEGIKDTLTFMTNNHTEDFTKALISVEKGIDDMDAVYTIYSDYMENDSMMLLND